MLKLLTFLIVSAALSAGLLAAATAYAPALENTALVPDGAAAYESALADESIAEDDRPEKPAYLELNANAGVAVLPDDLELADVVAMDDDAFAALATDDASVRRSVEMIRAHPAKADLILTPEAGPRVVLTKSLATVPLYEKDTELTQAHLDTLRANATVLAGTRYETKVLRVKSFGFGRWSYSWVAGVAIVGLLLGGFIARASKRVPDEAESGVGDAAPEQMLQNAEAELRTLQRDLARMSSEHDQLHTIITRLDSIQQNLLVPFVEARSIAIARLGMSGYAQLMDHFAAAERLLNRSWSAAADHVADEAIEALQLGTERLHDAVVRYGEVHGQR